MTEYANAIGTGLREASILLTPDPGQDIYDALNNARMRGFRSITVHDNNTATVVLYQED